MKLLGIVIVHTKKGFLPRMVQRFQTRRYKLSGRYNHSMLLIETAAGKLKLFEASYKDYGKNKGKYKNAGAYINDLEPYLTDNFDLRVLEPKFHVQEQYVEDAVYQNEGTPYDFSNLIIHQVIYYLWDRWWGRRNPSARKRMVCHELTMTTINDMMELQGFPPVFDDAKKAQIEDIFTNRNFRIMMFSSWMHNYTHNKESLRAYKNI